MKDDSKKVEKQEDTKVEEPQDAFYGKCPTLNRTKHQGTKV